MLLSLNLLGCEMNIIIKRTIDEYYKIIDWLFVHCDNWKTIEVEYRDDNCSIISPNTMSEWAKIKNRRNTPEQQELAKNLGNRIIIGNFLFENKKDAFKFKLCWGGK